MINSSDITVFLTNSQRKPTFFFDTVIVLTKDYTTLDPVCNRYLKKEYRNCMWPFDLYL